MVISVKNIALCLVLCVVLCVRMAGASPAGSPAQAVDAVQRALATADVALFESAVDVEAIIGQVVDVFLQDAHSPEGKAALPPVLAMLFASVQDNAQAQVHIRAFLQREVAEFVRYGVRSGHFGGVPREAARPAGMLAPLFADVSLGRKEIYAVRPAVIEGTEGTIAFMVRDHGNGNTYPVVARYQHTPSGRIVGIANIHALMEQIRNESAE